MTLHEKICVEYVWLDGASELRSKTRVLDGVDNLSQVPTWNYDGSSTGQALGTNSEIILKPCCQFTDPFRKYPHKMVLCCTYTTDDQPLENNNRVWADTIFSSGLHHQPWFGIEQEYFLMDPQQSDKPIGCQPEDIKSQGQYYCGTGTENIYGRDIAEEHLQYCIYAGIKIAGINAEVAPGQWEFQIGPCVGIEQGDHLWMARYILNRVAEKYNASVNYHPKPLEGDWNGSGCHTNVSTVNMRHGTDNKTGLEYINDAIAKLEARHDEHMKVYGTDNEKRMTGEHETSSYNKFSSGIANRAASVRIGSNTVTENKGYFEDRRPSSNCDPYLVTGKIFETIIN